MTIQGDQLRTTTKNPCRAASTGNLSLSTLAVVDGVTLAAGDRVLVKNQTVSGANGIYLAASGAWSRVEDMNDVILDQIEAGLNVYVQEGTVNAKTTWVLTTSGTIILGTTGLTFESDGTAGSVADVVGPGSSTDTAIPKWSGTTGTLLVDSTILINSSGNIVPSVTDNNALGTAALQWSDLFLAGGGVLDFANGNSSITHSTDDLLIKATGEVRFHPGGAVSTTVWLPADNGISILPATTSPVTPVGGSLLWVDPFLKAFVLRTAGSHSNEQSHEHSLLNVVQNIVLHSDQLQALGTGLFLRQATAYWMDSTGAQPSASDTFIIKDSVTTETWTFQVGVETAPFQVQIKGTIALTMQALTDAITADSTKWDAVYNADSLSLPQPPTTAGCVVIYRATQIGAASGDRIYGSFATGTHYTINFGDAIDYRAMGDINQRIALPSSDPTTRSFGYGRTNSFFSGDILVTLLDNKLYQADKLSGSYKLIGTAGQPTLSIPGTDNHVTRMNGTNALQDSLLIIDDSGNLSGVGNLLMTGNHTITNPTSPTLSIYETAGSEFQIYDADVTNTVINKTTAAGSSSLYLNALPGDGSSAANLILFRNTSTTGLRRFTVHLGDGTGTKQHELSTADSYLNAQGGNVGIGAITTPKEQLEVFGGIAGDYLLIDEQGVKPTTSAGEGAFWVKSDAPNAAHFVDDSSTDWKLLGHNDAGVVKIDNSVDFSHLGTTSIMTLESGTGANISTGSFNTPFGGFGVGGQNQIVQSKDFSLSPWTLGPAAADSVTILSTIISAPNYDQLPGARQLQLVNNTNNGNRELLRHGSLVYTPSLAYTVSFWARKVSGNFTGMFCVIGATASSTLTIGTTWKRYVFTATTNVSPGTLMSIYLSGHTTGTNDVVDIWGVQLESGSAASLFLPTSGAAFSGSFKGLLNTGNLRMWEDAGSIYWGTRTSPTITHDAADNLSLSAELLLSTNQFIRFGTTTSSTYITGDSALGMTLSANNDIFTLKGNSGLSAAALYLDSVSTRLYTTGSALNAMFLETTGNLTLRGSTTNINNGAVSVATTHGLGLKLDNGAGTGQLQFGGTTTYITGVNTGAVTIHAAGSISLDPATASNVDVVDPTVGAWARFSNNNLSFNIDVEGALSNSAYASTFRGTTSGTTTVEFISAVVNKTATATNTAGLRVSLLQTARSGSVPLAYYSGTAGNTLKWHLNGNGVASAPFTGQHPVVYESAAAGTTMLTEVLPGMLVESTGTIWRNIDTQNGLPHVRACSTDNAKTVYGVLADSYPDIYGFGWWQSFTQPFNDICAVPSSTLATDLVWDGTTTITTTDTAGITEGSTLRLISDGNWFNVVSVVDNTSITILAEGRTIPTGSGASASAILEGPMDWNTYTATSKYFKAQINFTGDGLVWAVDAGTGTGPANGDYLSSSAVVDENGRSGYARLQADDLQHNYTVAKVAEAVDWTSVVDTFVHLGTTYKRKLIAVMYLLG